MFWLYLFSGGLALFVVETADAEQPWHITLIVAFLLCVFPASIDAIYGLRMQRLSKKNLINQSSDQFP